MEQVIEQSVLRMVVPSKKIAVIKIFKIVSIVLAVLSLFYALMMTVSDNAIEIIFTLLVGFMPMTSFIGLFFLLDYFYKNLTKEFDYFINGNRFLIVRVYKNSRRKKFFECNVSDFEAIGKINSDEFERFESRKSAKKYNATLNVDAVENLYFALVKGDLLYFEPNEELLKGIRLTIGRDITVGKKEGYKY